MLKWGTKSPNKYLTRSSGILSVACSQDTSSQCNCTKFSLTTFHSTEVVSNPLVAMFDNVNVANQMSINLYHNQVYFNSKNSKSNSNLLYKKNRCQYQLSMDAIYHCWKSRDQTRFYTISIPTNPTGNSTATRSFEIFQFLAIFSEFLL